MNNEKNMSRFEKNLNILKALSEANKKQIKKLITECDKEFLLITSEFLYNIVRGNAPVTKKQLAQLKKYKTSVTKLCNKKTSLKSRKHILENLSKTFFSLIFGIVSNFLQTNAISNDNEAHK